MAFQDRGLPNAVLWRNAISERASSTAWGALSFKPRYDDYRKGWEQAAPRSLQSAWVAAQVERFRVMEEARAAATVSAATDAARESPGGGAAVMVAAASAAAPGRAQTAPPLLGQQSAVTQAAWGGRDVAAAVPTSGIMAEDAWEAGDVGQQRMRWESLQQNQRIKQQRWVTEEEAIRAIRQGWMAEEQEATVAIRQRRLAVEEKAAVIRNRQAEDEEATANVMFRQKEEEFEAMRQQRGTEEEEEEEIAALSRRRAAQEAAAVKQELGDEALKSVESVEVQAASLILGDEENKVKERSAATVDWAAHFLELADEDEALVAIEDEAALVAKLHMADDDADADTMDAAAEEDAVEGSEEDASFRLEDCSSVLVLVGQSDLHHQGLPEDMLQKQSKVLPQVPSEAFESAPKDDDLSNWMRQLEEEVLARDRIRTSVVVAVEDQDRVNMDDDEDRQLEDDASGRLQLEGASVAVESQLAVESRLTLTADSAVVDRRMISKDNGWSFVEDKAAREMQEKEVCAWMAMLEEEFAAWRELPEAAGGRPFSAAEPRQAVVVPSAAAEEKVDEDSDEEGDDEEVGVLASVTIMEGGGGCCLGEGGGHDPPSAAAEDQKAEDEARRRQREAAVHRRRRYGYLWYNRCPTSLG